MDRNGFSPRLMGRYNLFMEGPQGLFHEEINCLLSLTTLVWSKVFRHSLQARGLSIQIGHVPLHVQRPDIDILVFIDTSFINFQQVFICARKSFAVSAVRLS